MFLLCLALRISVLFFLVIRRFVLTVLLAAVFAGVAHPLQRWPHAHMGRRLAAAATLVVLVAGVGLPIAGFLTLVATEAVQVSPGAEAWFQEEGRTARAQSLFEQVPFAGRLLSEGGQVMEQLREAAGRTGSVLMGVLAAATRGSLSCLDATATAVREDHLLSKAQIDETGLPVELLKNAMAYEKAFYDAGGTLAAGVDPTGNGGALPGYGDQPNEELLIEGGSPRNRQSGS